MQLDYAPMEGVTYHTYRRLHNEMFPGADRYFSPFLAPDSTGKYKAGSMKDVLPENNTGLTLIPQVLANKAEAFLSIARELTAMGYQEINLNAGCPSGCVFSKKKGAGMLTDLTLFEAFLDSVFSEAPCKISVKTRMGVESTQEFENILKLYNRYPFSELIVHARARNGMYKSEPDVPAFTSSLAGTEHAVIYNGNIYSKSDFDRITHAAPGLRGVMIGRGAVSNPALFRQLKGGAGLSVAELREFHDRYLALTLNTGLSEYFTVNRMKELWYYMEFNFVDASKLLKTVYKCRNVQDYRAATAILFNRANFLVQGFGH